MLSRSLKSFDAPPARKFALRQLELVRQGMNKLAAREAVEVGNLTATLLLLPPLFLRVQRVLV